MGALTAAFHQRLAGDPTLATLLATYNGRPAVFTSDPAPADAELPFVVSAGEVAQEPADTKTTRGRTIYRDVRCYAAETGSAAQIEAIAERVRALFHRYPLAVAGYGIVVAVASGPIPAPDDDDTTTGRVVTVRLTMQEIP